MISSLCKTTYTLRSPQQRSSPIPWSWYFPGAGLRLQSEAPWSGPLVQCQSHPWLSGETKGEKNSMLNQDHSGGLLTPAVPSSCSLITPVVVSLVNKNRRRSLKKKKRKKENKRGVLLRDCEPHEHWYEIHRQTQHHWLPSRQKESDRTIVSWKSLLSLMSSTL